MFGLSKAEYICSESISMDSSTAFKTLNIPEGSDSDEIIDAYEELLFVVKQFFLTNAPIRLLFEKRLMKAEEYFSALSFLIPPSELKSRSLSELSFNTVDNKELISDFEINVAAVKRQISKAFLFADLKFAVESYLEIQERFEEKLWIRVISIFGEVENWPDGFNSEVKISDGLNSVLIKRSLENYSRDEMDAQSRNELLSEAYKIYKKLKLKKA